MPYVVDFNSGHQLTAGEVNDIKNSGVVQVADDLELAAVDTDKVKVAYRLDDYTLYHVDVVDESTGAEDWVPVGSDHAVYDSGWQTINGQKFRRVNYTVFGQGTISTPDVADLTDTEFVPTHPISVSAHYDADKTISNPVYSDGPLLKVNSQNGEDVVWSGSWSTNAEIPGLPDSGGGSSATVTNLVADPAETSVTLTWDVE